MRCIQHNIDLILEASLQNLPSYRIKPMENESIKHNNELLTFMEFKLMKALSTIMIY